LVVHQETPMWCCSCWHHCRVRLAKQAKKRTGWCTFCFWKLRCI